MKKQIIILLLGVLCSGLLGAQTVIFDPSTYDASTLPEGMIIEQIDGVDYLRVIVNGWDSKLVIPVVSGVEGNRMGANVIFGQIDPTDDKVMKVQCMDTINTQPNWDGSEQEPAACVFGQDIAEDGAAYMKGEMYSTMTDVHVIQFFGQERTNWGATTGDTIWCGKIMSFDASVLFDPSTIDPATLPEGYSIVEEDGKTLLKVKVNGWVSLLPIRMFETDSYNKVVIEDMKYDQGETDYAVSGVKTHYEFKYDDASIGMSEIDAGPATFTKDTADIKMNDTVNIIQFAVMETTNWSAITDAYLYIGKVTAFFQDKIPAEHPESVELNYTSDAIVLDGLLDESYLGDGYDVSKIAMYEAGSDIPQSQSSGLWWACADLDNFYFYIEVKDDNPIDISDESIAPWMNDCVELFIDVKNRSYIGGARITGEQHQIRLNLGRTGPLTGDVDGVTNLGMPGFFASSDTTNIEYTFVKGSMGYALECVVPWATWFRTTGNTNEEALAESKTGVTSGMKVGFEVSIVDADAVDSRVSIINWSNDSGTDASYLTNEYFGELTLVGAFPAGINTPSSDVESLKLYPNPVNGILTIDIATASNIKVYGLQGALIMERSLTNGNTIDVSHLKDGMYLVKATDINGKIAVAKIIKE